MKINRVEDQAEDKVYEDHRHKLSDFKQRISTSPVMNERSVSAFNNFESKEAHQKRKLREQIKVYLITYVSYAVIHFQREFWSMSKTNITKQLPEITKEQMSRFDTAQLFFYAVFLYICGILGDSYDQRKVLSVAFAGLGLFFFLLSLAGFLAIHSLAYFYFVQIFIGIFNAFLLPCMIAIMANWFPKKNRGVLVSLWGTCNNFGNIAGIQLAAVMLDGFDGHWEYLQVLAGVTAVIIFAVVWFFLIPHPEMVGIHVEEMTEKEALIASVQEKEIFENVIRPSRASLASPDEVI